MMKAYAIAALSIVLLVCLPVQGVKTQFLVDEEAKDFKEGTYENIVISNLGRIALSLKLETILEKDKDVSAVFAIGRLSDGTIVAATGPNGKVLTCAKGEWKELFKADQPYVFSLVVGKSDKMYIGTAGSEGKVYELTPDGKSKLIFREKDVQYVWALALVEGGRLLAATGPTGKVFQIDKTGTKCVFTCKQKNVISMASGPEGKVYLGTDTEGVVYVLEPAEETYTSRALFDAPEDQISAVVVDGDGNVYFGTASGKVAPGRAQAFLKKPAGVPASETQPAKKAQTRPADRTALAQKRPVGMVVGKREGPPRPQKGNAIYRIDPMGFVSEVFRDELDFCWLAWRDERLFAGTWPDGWLLELSPEREEVRTAAKADAKFIYSVLLTETDEMLLACGSPGSIVRLGPGLAEKGTFTSRPLDAGQIARWGKLSVEQTDSSAGTATIETRTGAVEDPKDPNWSQWSPAKGVNEAHLITSPPARFIQYRLTLTSKTKPGRIIEKVKLAYMQDNQAPHVVSLDVEPPGEDKDGPPRRPSGPQGKPNVFKLSWKAVDPNDDEMRYDVYLCLTGTPHWLTVEKDLEQPKLSWDPIVVPDGEYVFKVVASDRPDNPVDLSLSAARVSDPVIIDKTPPEVCDLTVEPVGEDKIVIRARLVDALSDVSAAWVRLNAEEQWQYIAPADEIYDSHSEYVETVMDRPKDGVLLVAVKVRDKADNVGYGRRVTTKPVSTTRAVTTTETSR